MEESGFTCQIKGASGEKGEEGHSEDVESTNDTREPAALEVPVSFPETSKRRQSAFLSKQQAGCYLTYDQTNKKWVATWSPEYIGDAVAIVTPTVKVPQFKYNKKEKVVLENAKSSSRDVRRDFMEGFCMFFKLVRDFKGDLTLLPSGEDHELKNVSILGLHGNQLVRFDKFDYTYTFADLDCIGIVPKNSLSFNAKTMEMPIFVGKASQEGFALSLKSRP